MRTSPKDRCIQSGLAFLAGFFEGRGSLPDGYFPPAMRESKKLNPSDTCPRFKKTVKGPSKSELQKCLDARDSIRAAAERINALYPEDDITEDDVVVMYDLCSFDVANNLRTNMPYCQLLELPEIVDIEYCKDYKAFVKCGRMLYHTNHNAQALTSVWTRNVIEAFQAKASGDSDAFLRASFSFSHDSFLLLLLNALVNGVCD
eukprot:GFYU01044849.1.p1 GENE.GFYU01044849.1~~GFYU01044849.1.p1  ORF type:complete len:238 (+),score=56.83 GFYU01044849.1:106-714(+)